MKQYPECAPLGSDAAELTAFALSLRLLSKLKSEGHTRQCATLMVGANEPRGCGRTKR